MPQSYSGELVSNSEGTYLRVHFYDTVKYASITTDKFTLTRADATPSVIGLKAVDRDEDYNTISRTLNLYPSSNLSANTTYELAIAGLVNVIGQPIPEDTITFETGDVEVVIREPTPEPVVVIDNSLVEAPFTPTTTTSGDDDTVTTQLSIVSTDPADGSVFLEEDHNDGRIVIRFSSRPSEDFVNSNFFIVQRKPIQRKPARWETVAAEIELHETNPWVYVNLPSTDDTPVYGVAGKTYLVKNYKYRIRVLEAVAV